MSKLAPAKCFRLVREIPECTTEFKSKYFQTFLLVIYTFHIKFYFSAKRQRKSTRNLSRTCHWQLNFVILRYSTLALRHARHVSKCTREHVSTQGTLASGYVSTQDTLAPEHTRHVDTWGRKHVKHVGMWDVSTQDTLARDHLST